MVVILSDMRRIKECREDWRKYNNSNITPENIFNYSGNLSSTNINKDLHSEENLKLKEVEKENLRTWIAGPKIIELELRMPI